MPSFFQSHFVMKNSILLFFLIVCSLCCFAKEKEELNAFSLHDAFIHDSVISPTDSVDNFVWAKANIESLILHKDTGPFEKGDSLYLHKTFFVVSYRVVSAPEDKILGQSNFSYQNYSSVVWLISEDLCDTFKISSFQFGFPPSINSICERVTLPFWFASLYSNLPKPQIFWQSNIYGLKYFN